MDQKQNITLNIYETKIPIKVLPEQEEYYREVSKLLNDRLNQYFKTYKGLKDNVEIYYYVMIDVALRYVMERRKNSPEEPMKLIDDLTKEIEYALKE